MKNKIFYLIGTFAIIATSVVATLTLSNIDFNSLFNSHSSIPINSEGMPVDMAMTPKGVKDTINELESYRSHLNESCIYGAAMMLNDLSGDATKVIESEHKCIHTLVMSVIRERKLKIAAKRLAQFKTDEEKLTTSESSPLN